MSLDNWKLKLEKILDDLITTEFQKQDLNYLSSIVTILNYIEKNMECSKDSERYPINSLGDNHNATNN